MSDKNEKLRRKQLLNEIKEKQKNEFEKNLPMSRDNFKKLFDYLDNEFETKECDNTNSLTKHYLNEIGMENIDNILNWMANHGGYCDCEILANVEELFG